MKTIMSFVVALLVLLAQAAPASAETVCSEGMITSTYGVVGSTIAPENLYCGIVGVMTLKKGGTAKGTVKQSCAGMTQASVGTGTFTVQPNCTAKAVIDFNDGTRGKFFFTIVDGGKTLLFIGEQPGVTFTGTAQQL